MATCLGVFVEGRLVKGDSHTQLFDGTSYADLADGERVEVEGQQPDGFVYAERMHVNTGDDDQPQDESASIHGKIQFLTESSTVVQRRGDVQGLDTLKQNMDVHVVGVRRADGSIDARRIQINDDPAGGEFEIEGSVGGLSGSCPAVTFKLNGQVQADGSVRRRGSAPAE